MKKKIFFFGLMICCVNTFAQAPAVDWMKRYGGSSFEIFSSLITTVDGGFLFGGYSDSGISGVKTEAEIGYTPDYWVVKTDAEGVIQWQKTIGGGMPNLFGDLEGEILKAVKQSTDGGYFLGGNSDSPVFGSKTVPNYGFQDFWIVKINAVGDILWQADIGGSNYDEAYTLEATPDGGCIAGGYSKSGISGNKTDANRGLKDYWVVKLDAQGQIEWQKSYGGSSDDILYAITVLDNQEYLLTGASASNISGDKTDNSKGGGDFWIIKVNATGAILWQKTIGGNSSDEAFEAIKVTDGFVFCGASYSNISFDKSENSRGAADYWVVKTDFQGNVLWDKTFGGDQDDFGIDMVSFLDGSGYAVVGGSTSGISGDKSVPNYGVSNGWILRLDQSGNLLWQKGIGGSGSDGFNEIVALPDNSLVLGGAANSPVSGNITDGGYGSIDYFLVRLVPENLGVDDVTSRDFYAYPSPVKDSITIVFKENQKAVRIMIYNSLGQSVNQFEFSQVSEVTLPFLEGTGVYYMKVEGDKGKRSQIRFLKK